MGDFLMIAGGLLCIVAVPSALVLFSAALARSANVVDWAWAKWRSAGLGIALALVGFAMIRTADLLEPDASATRIAASSPVEGRARSGTGRGGSQVGSGGPDMATAPVSATDSRDSLPESNPEIKVVTTFQGFEEGEVMTTAANELDFKRPWRPEFSCTVHNREQSEGACLVVFVLSTSFNPGSQNSWLGVVTPSPAGTEWQTVLQPGRYVVTLSPRGATGSVSWTVVFQAVDIGS